MNADKDGVLPVRDPAAVPREYASDAGWQGRRALEHDTVSPDAPYRGASEVVASELGGRTALEADAPSRRDMLQWMAASLAIASADGCAQSPVEKIVPYVRTPESILPGKPLHFATSMALGGVGIGVLVESHMGRPIKVEGNPDHPASLGGTDVFAQASILTLYDPDRSQAVKRLGQISSWGVCLQELRSALTAQRGHQGTGLRVLTETITSPTLHHQLRLLINEFPRAKWHQYEPAGRGSVRRGARLAFGEPVTTVYRFDRADVILSLDADFLCCGPGRVRYTRDFAARRRIRNATVQSTNHEPIARLYVIESALSNTGAKADHRLAVRPSAVAPFARALASEISNLKSQISNLKSEIPHPEFESRLAEWTRLVARDLWDHRGSSIVVVGDEQPAHVHALAHAINNNLGNVGSTLYYTDPIEAEPVDEFESITELVRDMNTGQVELLLILGGNPVFTAPVDLNFSESLDRVKLRVHLSLYDDETSELCHWHIPESHYLESWSDVRAFDGTVSVIQPLIAPLYGGKSAHEMVAAFTNASQQGGYGIVREYWRASARSPRPGDSASEPPNADDDFEQLWHKVLHDGLMAGTALPEKSVAILPQVDDLTLPRLNPEPRRGGTQKPQTLDPLLDIVFRTDPAIFDGQFANNGWLQELPRPLTRITWGNAALLSAATAQRIEIRDGDLIELKFQGRTVHAPVWIVPRHADDCVTVHLGYGRSRAGKVGTGIGFNGYAIRTSDSPWSGAGVQVRKTGMRSTLACTQHHHSMEGRDIVRSGTLAELRHDSRFTPEDRYRSTPTESLYPPFESTGYKWGMVIDLSSCTGCGACVVACQAENNIPIVGKSEVLRGHEMHWLRVDMYHTGGSDSLQTYFQPVPCMHCENAPCEVVCPVAATVHSNEGLNDMVYNRCVGTRYCSNNCPYKVRRFNFFEYSDFHTPSLKLMRNPDVTVRSRGVMEKCTYCVQRINAARIGSEKEDRRIRDGEVVTACQSVCPAQAIVFGNLADHESNVSQWHTDPLNYALLAELNTRPRTTYLAAVRHPNSQVEGDRRSGEFH